MVGYLRSNDQETILNKNCAELIKSDNCEIFDTNELGNHCDLIIAIGGDGTMLKASHSLCDFNVPLLGINLGHVGFLADIPADNISKNLNEIMSGNYVEDIRFFLNGQVFRKNKCIYEGYALNDIVIQKWNIAHLLELETCINGSFVHIHRSDGMIVASPTGSTAYSMAAGGPIILPSLDAIIVSAICPMSLASRPIVVPPESQLVIKPIKENKQKINLWLDGSSGCLIEADDTCLIKKSNHSTSIIILDENLSYYKTITQKLHWASSLNESSKL